MSFIISAIIVLLIAGFVLWAVRKLLSLVPMDAQIKQVVDVLIVILVAAAILFYVVIPLIQMLGHMSLPGLR